MACFSLSSYQYQEQVIKQFQSVLVTVSLAKCFHYFVTKNDFFSQQNSTLTIEEFHSKLQEATNFPLRPFVIPFLKVLHSSVIWKVFQTILLLGHRCVLQFFFLRESGK